MQIFCPNCALQISIEEGVLGSKGQCPRCSHKFIVSAAHRHPPDGDDLGTAPTIKIVKDEGFDFDLGPGRTRWVGSESFVLAVIGMVLLMVAAAVALWSSTVASRPVWLGLPASWHGPFGYGAMAILIAALGMEILGRNRRFEYLQGALPILLGMAILGLFGAQVTGACAPPGSGGHVAMALFASLMATVALVLASHLQERPERDRTMILVIIALGIGALLVAAHLGKSGLETV